MTIYDAAMAIVVVAGMVRGAWLGITWQLASIASLVLGYVVSHQTSTQLAPYFPGDPEVARSLAMATIYVAVSAGVFGMARLVRGALHKLKFEAYDRHLGMLLGGMEATCVGMLVTMFVVSLAPATRQPIFSSATGRVVGSVMNNLGPFLPDEVRKVLTPHWGPNSSSLVVDATANNSRNGSGKAAESTAKIATSSVLPSIHEATPAGDRSASNPHLPALPPLEAAPGTDPAVQPANASSLDSLVDQARRQAEQAVAETLDPDSGQKAANIRDLVKKQKEQVKAALGKLGNAQKKAGDELKNRLSKGQQRVEQTVRGAANQGRQELGQTVTDSIDRELRRLDDLVPAPQAAPK